jgi:hypothetical protein
MVLLSLVLRKQLSLNGEVFFGEIRIDMVEGIGLENLLEHEVLA